jgi:predicted alpha/beta hydrolase family esterase
MRLMLIGTRERADGGFCNDGGIGLTVVTVPGWMGSGPAHWQTLWEEKHPDYRRVVQRDWRSVRLADWVLALDETISFLERNVVLVAHSLGCLSVAAWAAANLPGIRLVAGAMLVAPPDLATAPGCLPALSNFVPVPAGRLPFPSLVVASEDDPYATVEAASTMASGWGSQWINVGRAGHINVDSGHGDWPEGEQYLQDFLRAVQASRPHSETGGKYEQTMDANGGLAGRQRRHGTRF